MILPLVVMFVQVLCTEYEANAPPIKESCARRWLSMMTRSAAGEQMCLLVLMLKWVKWEHFVMVLPSFCDVWLFGWFGVLIAW